MQKPIELMVGSNFDPNLPTKMNELNIKYKDNNIQIHEVFGSIQGLKLFGTARPRFRVPSIDFASFEKSVEQLNKFNILVNYTDNTPIVNKHNIDMMKIRNNLKYLEDIGIGRLTIAHPLAMEIISEYSTLPIEVSTIYQANTPYKIRELKRRFPNVNKICVDVSLNRDFDKLLELQKEAQLQYIELELLANELCIKDCVDRIQCYNEHTQCETDEETSKFKRYPMGNCTRIRNSESPVEWTRAPFILPQSLEFYKNETSINKFKITGRTSTTEYILKLIEMYLSKNFEGNLLELWSDVKNISRLSKGKDELLPEKYTIDAKMYGNEFIEMYKRGEMKDLDVEYDVLNRLLETSMS